MQKLCEKLELKLLAGDQNNRNWQYSIQLQPLYLLPRLAFFVSRHQKHYEQTFFAFTGIGIITYASLLDFIC